LTRAVYFRTASCNILQIINNPSLASLSFLKALLIVRVRIRAKK